MAGRTSGSVTFVVVVHRLAPEESEASSRLGSMERRAPPTIRKTNGVS